MYALLNAIDRAVIWLTMSGRLVISWLGNAVISTVVSSRNVLSAVFLYLTCACVARNVFDIEK